MTKRTRDAMVAAVLAAMAMSTEARAETRYFSGHACQSIENDLTVIAYGVNGAYSTDTYERRLLWCPITHDVLDPTDRTIDLYINDAATSSGENHQFQCSVKYRNQTTGTLYTTSAQTSSDGYQTLTFTGVVEYAMVAIACYVPRADSATFSSILGYRVTF